MEVLERLCAFEGDRTEKSAGVLERDNAGSAGSMYCSNFYLKTIEPGVSLLMGDMIEQSC